MVDRTDHDGIGGLTAEDPLFDMVLDLRIAAIHGLLNAAAAARTFRDAFPEAPFNERGRAPTDTRRQSGAR